MTDLREEILTEYDEQYVRGAIDYTEYEAAKHALFPDE